MQDDGIADIAPRDALVLELRVTPRLNTDKSCEFIYLPTVKSLMLQMQLVYMLYLTPPRVCSQETGTSWASTKLKSGLNLFVLCAM
jgi:hypothetical protein